MSIPRSIESDPSSVGLVGGAGAQGIRVHGPDVDGRLALGAREAPMAADFSDDPLAHYVVRVTASLAIQDGLRSSTARVLYG